MKLDAILTAAGMVGYTLAVAQALVALVRPSPAGERRVNLLLAAAGVALGAVLVWRAVQAGRIPAFTRFEALTAYAVILTFTYLRLVRIHDPGGLSVILAPYLLILCLAALPNLRASSSGAPALQNVWLVIHILAAFAGYALFTLAAVLAAAYLVQDHNLKRKHFGPVFQRLPSLESLDQLMYREVGVAFFFFSVSIVLGVLNVHLGGGGAEWLVDPKIGATIATWALYATLMHIRGGGVRRGRSVALLTLTGLVLVLFTFMGVSLVGESAHDAVRMGAARGPAPWGSAP